jgi:cellulose synthase (UDP-forming)
MMLASFILPVIAVLFDMTFVDVGYIDFLKHFVPMSGVLLLLATRWKRWGILRPQDARVVSWEGIAFQLVRWPWTLAGTAAALVDWYRGRVAEFRVTPKGLAPGGPLPLRVFIPYALLSVASAAPVLLVGGNVEAQGFYIFCAVNATLYGLVAAGVSLGHWRADGRVGARRAFVTTGLSVLLVATSLTGLSVRGLSGLEGLTWGPGGFRVVRTTFSVAGAGQGAAGVRRLNFERWTPSETLRGVH